MKLNNKGFAITAIIYGLMLLFLLMISSFLTVLVDRNRKTDLLLQGIYSSIECPVIEVTYYSEADNFKINGNEVGKDGAFVTSKRAKYRFNYIGSHNTKKSSYVVYFPKSVIILSDKAKMTNDQNLYYKFGSDNIEDLDLDKYNKIDNIKIN